MAAKILSLMLAVTQLMSWAGLPLYLCISKSGSVCVDLGLESCASCSRSNQQYEENDQRSCCNHCDPTVQRAVSEHDTCDCMHIPLMIGQADSIRPTVFADMSSFGVPVARVDIAAQIVPRTDHFRMPQWDRRIDSSPHLAAIATTVLRC